MQKPRPHVHDVTVYSPGHYTVIHLLVVLYSKQQTLLGTMNTFFESTEIGMHYAIELTVEYVEPNEQPKFWVPNPVFE